MILVISGQFNEINIKNFTLTNVLIKLNLQKRREVKNFKTGSYVKEYFIEPMIYIIFDYILFEFFLIEFLFYQDYNDWPNMVSQMNCDVFVNFFAISSALEALNLIFVL